MKLKSLHTWQGTYRVIPIPTKSICIIFLWAFALPAMSAQQVKRDQVIPLKSGDSGEFQVLKNLDYVDSLKSATICDHTIDYGRLALVTGAAVGTLGVSYLYLSKTWWKDSDSKFHFDDGADLKYALNLDKAAHFYGGSIAADMFHQALRWAHMNDRDALWFGAGLGVFVQLAIELKDGYAPRWGFSLWDVSAGSLGSLFYVGKQYVSFLDAIDLKFSYYKRSNRYYELKETGTWNDDYVNQTYWASIRVNQLLPHALEQYWPDWLALAVGIGVDDKIVGYDANYPERTGGSHELYLALDCDVTKILPSDNALWETIKHYVNYIKFPAPAIRFTPEYISYGIYF